MKVISSTLLEEISCGKLSLAGVAVDVSDPYESFKSNLDYELAERFGVGKKELDIQVLENLLVSYADKANVKVFRICKGSGLEDNRLQEAISLFKNHDYLVIIK